MSKLIKEIFVLLADSDGTMRSKDEPWGAAVESEDEAKAYVTSGNVGYSHSYKKIRIFKTFKEAEYDKYGD